MKWVALIMISGLMLALAGCGDDESTAGDGNQQNAVGQSQPLGPKPEVEPPSSPPKEVEVKDLEQGTGPAARLGDYVRVRFVAVDQAGDQVYNGWVASEPPLRFELGREVYGPGWDKGLLGMQAGGRREIQIPAGMAYQESGPLYYMVDMIEVEPGGPNDRAGT